MKLFSLDQSIYNRAEETAKQHFCLTFSINISKKLYKE